MSELVSGYFREDISGASVIYRDKEEFDRKYSAMIRGGREKLQVISDFDFTLTKYYQADGESRSASCHMVLEHSEGLLPDTYLAAAKELQSYYYPIEQDPTMDPDVKFQHMEDWVNKHNVLFMECGITQEIIQTAVIKAFETGKFRLREGLVHLMATLHDADVPLLIFSAGITNVLEYALQRSLSPEANELGQRVDPLPDSVNIISNRCLFDETTKELTGFSKPVLHVYNKSCDAFLETNPHFLAANGRSNVLLFGDSLGDIKMSQGLEAGIDTLIRVGFLNDKNKAADQLDTYLRQENYDLVILGDPGLQVQQYLVDSISSR